MVLDRDYMTIPEGEIADLKPVLTVVDGKVVFGEAAYIRSVAGH